MKARIINGAGNAFISKNLKLSSGMTREMREYIDRIVSLENVVLNVSRTCDKRIVLEYPEPEVNDERTVMGIDIETEFVEIVT